MFTGIIEEVGTIISIGGNKISVKASYVLQDAKLGDSISVNGVCLTITKINKTGFDADVSQETLSVTVLGDLKIGSCVNLERALSANGRFGGHIVSGHIDGKGKVINITKLGEFYNIEFELSSDCAKYTVKKGSISINGISLTIAEMNKNIIKIAVIPHTFENTNLKYLKPKDFVNIEVDMFAKYIEKFLSTGDNKSRIDADFLTENGFV